MIFNSVTFCLFLVLVTALYWALPRRPRLWLVFLSSLTFYGFWRVEFLPVMLVSTVTDYVVSLQLGKTTDKRLRRRLLAVSLVLNLGLLAYFKYLLFFAQNGVSLLHFVGIDVGNPTFKIILPLGISFYTFQTISYTVDVYRGFIKPERDFVLYGSYVCFFPQLVAGPVLRAREVIQQLSERSSFDVTVFGEGLRRILFGLFLKVVLADNIAGFVDEGYAQPVAAMSGLDVWTLAFLFGLQIYFDFAAYSHIALGSAKLMGIEFPENFNFPYMATSPRDFWKRWHISLSSWIRDYLYLPLAGRPVEDRSTGGLARAVDAGPQRSATIALFATWAIMGLWHGAAWTFVVWGVYHAVCIVVFRLTAPMTRGLPVIVRSIGGWAITLPIMMLGWIPFRAQGLENTFTMLGKALDPRKLLGLGFRENTYLITAALLLGMIVVWFVRQYVAPRLRRFATGFAAAEIATFSVIITLVFVYFRPISQFIYFQF